MILLFSKTIVKFYLYHYITESDSSRTLYNPWDTPIEDQAVSDMLSRLQLLKGGIIMHMCRIIFTYIFRIYL